MHCTFRGATGKYRTRSQILDNCAGLLHLYIWGVSRKFGEPLVKFTHYKGRLNERKQYQLIISFEKYWKFTKCNGKIKLQLLQINHLNKWIIGSNYTVVIKHCVRDGCGETALAAVLVSCIFWGGRSRTFGILISGNQWDTFSILKTLIGAAPIGC